MKKEDFINLGIDEETAKKCEQASTNELKGFVPKARLDEVIGEKKTLADKISTLETASTTAEQYKTELEKLQKQIQDDKDLADKQAREREVEEAMTARFAGVAGEAKFINDMTKEGIYTAFKASLGKDENKGKGDKEIYEALTKDVANIFENPNAPAPIPQNGHINSQNIDDNAARTIMGLPPIK